MYYQCMHYSKREFNFKHLNHIVEEIRSSKMKIFVKMNIFENRDTGVPITMIEMLELTLET